MSVTGPTDELPCCEASGSLDFFPFLDAVNPHAGAPHANRPFVYFLVPILHPSVDTQLVSFQIVSRVGFLYRIIQICVLIMSRDYGYLPC